MKKMKKLAARRLKKVIFAPVAVLLIGSAARAEEKALPGQGLAPAD